ncbi:MAG: tRNA (guanosine(37)-N1)-methyltransferase TrmD [Clostridia bacterium]|nr:tRNA (guanosine(37)-N1)-methyltransferase TrmD [Clostridia bacterium]
MRIDIVTLFPEMCENLLKESIIGRARSRGHLQVCCHQLRTHGEGVHKRVDDCTFGGGKGMLLMADPIAKSFDAIVEHTGVKPHILYMSPRGRVLNQEMVKELAAHESLIILCGHYEGVDARVLEEYDVEEVSIGDFVLTGGELPAVILTDAVSRMLPGVLSEDVCFEEESHYDGLLEYPQYTRPAEWRGRAVPDVLLSGHHENVRKWRRAESLKITRKMRPDLYEKVQLTKEDKRLLERE